MTKHLHLTVSRVSRSVAVAAIAALTVLPSSKVHAVLSPELQEVETEVLLLTGSTASLDPSTALPAPTTTILAQALRNAIENPAGFPADQLIGPVVNFRQTAVPILVGEAVAEVLDGGADGKVTTQTKFDKQRGIAGKVVTNAFAAINLNTFSDKSAVVAAVTAQSVTAVYNQTLSNAFKKSALSTIVKKAVKAVQVLPIDSATQVHVPDADDPAAQGLYPLLTTGSVIPDNRTETGNTANDGLAPTRTSAGAATGAVTQLQLADVSTNDKFVKVVVTAAVKAAKGDYLEIAQAAATAAGVVFTSGSKTIADYIALGSSNMLVKAVLNAFPITKRPKIKKAVKEAVAFGLAEAQLVDAGDLAHAGAGAKGVANYAWHSSTVGTPVTDVTGF